MVNSLLKKATRLTLMCARSIGAYSLIKRSSWRTHRLLILCYHGISLEDEHLWRPGLYISPQMFASRMELISRMNCQVLPLAEALDRLQAGTLPALSVAITFDDGFYDFYRCAHPILKRFGYPATVYQTTYYSSWNKPLFNLVCSYLFWKGSGKIIDAFPIIGRPGTFDLRTEEGIKRATSEILQFAGSADLSAQQRDSLAATLAVAVGQDYQGLCNKRLLHLMNRGELSEMVRQGADIQLHTHRHRVPRDRELFFRELRDNLDFLKGIGQTKAEHFTYPSGDYDEQCFTWLKECGVRSATTCETGFATSRSNFMCLPRLTDVPQISALEFEAWLCGLRDMLPARTASPKHFATISRGSIEGHAINP